MSTPLSRSEAERVRLLGYIARSRGVQRRLRTALPIGVIVAAALWFIDARLGMAALAVVGIVFGSGMWITTGHIAEWNTRLETLDAPARRAA